jgi:hypothetical protein
MMKRPEIIFFSQPYNMEHGLNDELTVIPNARRFYTESVGFGRVEIDNEQPSIKIIFSDVSPYLLWMMDYSKKGGKIDGVEANSEDVKQCWREGLQEVLEGKEDNNYNLNFVVARACDDIGRPSARRR